MEKHSQKVPKKTSDRSKIKSSNKSFKKTKTAVTHKGFQEVAPYSGVSNHSLPPPDKLREEARIQLEVQNRLKQLPEQAAPGTEKIKSQRGGSVEVLVKIGLNGPMSLCYPVKTRTGCLIISFPPSSEWLASAEP